MNYLLTVASILIGAFIGNKLGGKKCPTSALLIMTAIYAVIIAIGYFIVNNII